MSAFVRVAAALTLAVGLSACGGGERLPPPPAASPQRVALEITLDADGPGGRPPATTELRCPSPGREEICRRVLGLEPAVFRPVPGDAVCTKIYGGPQEGRIEGTIGRRRVAATFTRASGCEIARYDRVRFLLRLAR